jgi:hypothetical protein
LRESEIELEEIILAGIALDDGAAAEAQQLIGMTLEPSTTAISSEALVSAAARKYPCQLGCSGSCERAAP